MKPIVALVGRPNVGKSSIFNRLTRTRDAIVDNMPGVTRDRIYGDVRWDDTLFTLVDTGGYLPQDAERFAGEIRRQIDQAVAAADAVVLVLDGRSGISPFDADMVGLLRTVDKPTFYVVNKIDGPEHENRLHDFYRLGIDAPYAMSASHGYGVNDFMDDLTASLPRTKEAGGPTDAIRIGVVGRPNVGKSSLINRILGEERLVVSDVPGTTRDAIDTLCEVAGRAYRLVDTAGIRRKSRVSARLEKFSVVKALKTLDRCDVALLVLDAAEGVTEQDVSIGGYALERGCAVVMLLNKWDLVEKDHRTAKQLKERLRDQARFLSFAPSMTISALTGRRVPRIFSLVGEVYEQYVRRAGTGQINRVLEEATRRNEPSLHKGRRIKFYYATQVATRPPTFVLFVNFPEAVHFSYQRYLTNQFREALGLTQTPIRLIFRQRTSRSLAERRPG